MAGLGTRFLPATKAQPKEMLPVVDKPLIQYAVEEAYAAGIREMIFVTGRHKRPIEDHFDTTFELEVALQQSGKLDLLDVVRQIKPDDMECVYVRQPQALGLGHAVLCGRRLVGMEPFAVLLADDLMVGEVPVLKQMVEQFEHWRASIIAVQEVPAEHTHRYGIVAGNERRRAPAGRAAHRRKALARHRAIAPGRGGPLHPHARRVPRDRQPAARRGRRDPAHRRHCVLAAARKGGLAYRYEGHRHDCGSKEGFLQANVELALAHPELGPGFRDYLKSLKL